MGSAPAPQSGPSGPEFDLRPFQREYRVTKVPSFPTFLYLGLGFTAVGVTVGVVAGAMTVGITAFSVGLGAVIFGFCGFFPMILLLTLFPGRRWTTLRIEPGGFAVRSGGRRWVRRRWDEEALAISILQPIAPTNAGPGAGEAMLVTPGTFSGAIGPQAREALVAAAQAHGLNTATDRYNRPSNQVGELPVAVVAHSIVRGGPGVPPEPLREEVPATLPETFELSPVMLPQYSSSRAPPTNGLRSVTVTSTGVVLLNARGAKLALSWSTPKLRLKFVRRLTSPLEPVGRSAAVWLLSGAARSHTGHVGGRCYASVLASAQAAGLVVSTSRFPGPDRAPAFWLATTSVSRPPPARGAPPSMAYSR